MGNLRLKPLQHEVVASLPNSTHNYLSLDNVSIVFGLNISKDNCFDGFVFGAYHQDIFKDDIYRKVKEGVDAIFKETFICHVKIAERTSKEEYVLLFNTKKNRTYVIVSAPNLKRRNEILNAFIQCFGYKLQLETVERANEADDNAIESINVSFFSQHYPIPKLIPEFIPKNTKEIHVTPLPNTTEYERTKEYEETKVPVKTESWYEYQIRKKAENKARDHKHEHKSRDHKHSHKTKNHKHHEEKHSHKPLVPEIKQHVPIPASVTKISRNVNQVSECIWELH